MTLTRRAALGGFAVMVAGQAHACGFDGGLEMGFGIAHPLALDLVLAERAAVRQGLLPQEALLPILERADGLWITMDCITRFASRLGAEPIPDMALLMASSGFWARLTWQDGKPSLQNHAAGPLPDDVIVVSDQPVLAALLNGNLLPDQCLSHGLIRFEDNKELNTKISDAICRGFAQSALTRPQNQLNSRLPWARPMRTENRS